MENDDDESFARVNVHSKYQADWLNDHCPIFLASQIWNKFGFWPDTFIYIATNTFHCLFIKQPKKSVAQDEDYKILNWDIFLWLMWLPSAGAVVDLFICIWFINHIIHFWGRGKTDKSVWKTKTENRNFKMQTLK